MSEQSCQDLVYSRIVSGCENNSLSTLLLEDPQIFSQYNKDGETAFLVACRLNALNVVTSLVKCYPPCLHHLSQNGDTPLHMAAFGGATEVAEWLLQQHIDLNSVNKEGYTALHIASEFDYTEIVSLFLYRAKQSSPSEATSSPLHRAALFGAITSAKMLVAHGYDIQALDREGNTPLHCASRGCNLELAAWLLSVGADCTIANNDNAMPGDVTSSQTMKDLFEHHKKNGDALDFVEQFSESKELQAEQQAAHERIQDEEYHLLVKRAEDELELELALLNEEKLARRVRKSVDDENEAVEPNGEKQVEEDAHSESGSDFSDESVLSGASTATYIMPDDYCSEISDALTPLNLPNVEDVADEAVHSLMESPRSQVSEDRSVLNIRSSRSDLSSASDRVLPLVRSHSTISAEAIKQEETEPMALPVLFQNLKPLFLNSSTFTPNTVQLLASEIHINSITPHRGETALLDYQELYEIAKRGSVLNPIYDVDNSETIEAKEQHLMQRQVSAEVEYEEVYEPPQDVPHRKDDPAPATPITAKHESSRGVSKERSKRKLIVEKDPSQWRNLLQGFDRDEAPQKREVTPQWRNVLSGLDVPVRRNSADMRGSIEWRSLLKSIDNKALHEETKQDIDIENSELDDVPSEHEESSNANTAVDTDAAIAPSDPSDIDTIATMSRASSVSAVSDCTSSRPSQVALTPRQLRHMNSLDVFRTELPNDAFATISRLQLVNSPMYEDIRVEYLDAVAANLESVFVCRESGSESAALSHHSEEDADHEPPVDIPEQLAISADAVSVQEDLGESTPTEVEDVETYDDYFASHFESRSSDGSGDDSDNGDILLIAKVNKLAEHSEPVVVPGLNESEKEACTEMSIRDYDAVDVEDETISTEAKNEEYATTESEQIAALIDAVDAEEADEAVEKDEEEDDELDDVAVDDASRSTDHQSSGENKEEVMDDVEVKDNLDKALDVENDHSRETSVRYVSNNDEGPSDDFEEDIAPPVMQPRPQDNVWNASPRRLTFLTPKAEVKKSPDVEPEVELEPKPEPEAAVLQQSTPDQMSTATPPLKTSEPRTPHVGRNKDKRSTQLPTPPGHGRARPHYSTPTAAWANRSRKSTDSAPRQEERNHSVPPKQKAPVAKQKVSPRSKSEPPPQRKKRVTGFSDNHFIPVYESPSYKNVSSRLFKPTESYLNSCWRGDVSKKHGGKDISPNKSASKRTPKGFTPPRQHKTPPKRHASPATSARSDVSVKDHIDNSSNPEETCPRRHSASDYSNVKSRLYTPTEAFVNGRWIAQFEHQRKSFPSPELKVHVSERLLKPTTATLNGQWKGSPKSPNDDDAFRLPTLSNPRQFEHVESRLLHPTVASTHWRWDHEHPSPEHQYHHGHWWDKVPTTAEMHHEEGTDSPRYVPDAAALSNGHHSEDYFLMDVDSTSQQSEQSTY